MTKRRHLDEPGDDNSGIFGNKTADTVASFVPILGTLEDAYTFYKHPSWSNAGWLALSVGSDILTGGMASRAIKAARVANNAVDAARAANTAAANEFRAARAANGANHTRQSGTRVRQAINSAGSAANTRDAAIRRANDALFDAGIKVGVDQGVNNFLNAAQLNLLPQLGARRSLKSGGAIHIDPANRGKFNATKERTGKTTEELTHSKNPLTRKRAIFAQNAAKWNH